MKRPPELHNELHNDRCRRETRWYDQVSNDRVSVYVKTKTAGMLFFIHLFALILMFIFFVISKPYGDM